MKSIPNKKISIIKGVLAPEKWTQLNIVSEVALYTFDNGHYKIITNEMSNLLKYVHQKVGIVGVITTCNKGNDEINLEIWWLLDEDSN